MQCEICDEPLKSNRNLLSHLKSIHDTQPQKYYTEHPEARKFCSKCKQALPITMFLSDKSNNYGYRTRCIDCFKPGRITKKCPICSRTLQWSAIVTHLRDIHDVSTERAYHKYLKEKLCPKCKNVKSLDAFARSQNLGAPYFSYCTACNVDRNMKRTLADADFEQLFDQVTNISDEQNDVSSDAGRERSDVEAALDGLMGDKLRKLIEG